MTGQLPFKSFRAQKRHLTVLAPYPGTGKSYQTADHLATIAHAASDARGRDAKGCPVVRATYSAPSHVVASDMEQMLADRGVPPESVVHRWSVLVERKELDGTVIQPCARKDELLPLVEGDTGLSVRKICGFSKKENAGCPLRGSCAAFAAAQADDERVKTAAVEIVTHAALAGEAQEQQLICDEPPSYLDDIKIASDVLALIRSEKPVRGALAFEREIARQVARCWLGGRSYADLPSGKENDNGDSIETIGDWLRGRAAAGSAFDVVNGQDLPDASKATLRALRGLRDVLRVAAFDISRGGVERKGVKVLETAVPSAAIMRLREQGGILLDGTPWLAALEALFDGVDVFGAEEPEWDWLPVRREWRASDKTTTSMTSLLYGYWDGKTFDPKTECRLVDGAATPGINWPLIENELRLSLASCSGSTLLASFKKVHDVLEGSLQDWVERPADDLAPAELLRLASLQRVREMVTERRVQLGHFGAMRSRNDWRGVRQVLVIGTPYLGARHVAEALGLESDAASAAQSAYAQGELIQTAERGRSVQRDDDQPLTLTLVCAPGAVPAGWTEDSEWVPGAGERNAYGVLALSREERVQRARWWLRVAVRAHGEPAVKAVVAPALSARQWRAWRSGEGSQDDCWAVADVDGLLAGLLPRGLFSEGWETPREERPEVQAEWREMLDLVKGRPDLGEWRAKVNQLRVRGRDWLIPREVGQALESLLSVQNHSSKH
jgi:hypothetical protein